MITACHSLLTAVDRHAGRHFRSELANWLNQAVNAYLDALSERKFDAGATQLQRSSDLIERTAQQPQ